jgi:hypothetical protein
VKPQPHRPLTEPLDGHRHDRANDVGHGESLAARTRFPHLEAGQSSTA